MCTRLKVAKSYITPGMIVQYRVLSGVKSGKFGMQNTSFTSLNARMESLGNVWKGLFITNRGVIEADSFSEKGVQFGKVNKPTNIACIFDQTGNFAVITTNSTPEVAKVHHRMPAIIEDIDAWLSNGVLKLADSDIQQVTI